MLSRAERLGTTSVRSTSGSPLMGLVNPYDASGGALSPRLPSLSSVRVGDIVVVRKVDGSANAVSVLLASGDSLLDGSSTATPLASRNAQAVFEVTRLAGDLYWSHEGPADAGGGGTLDVYSVDSYGADATGATSSDAAVAAAMEAMGSSPGVLKFGIGTYQLSETMTFVGDQGLEGRGSAATILNWVGTGDCIRMYDSTVDFPSKTGLINSVKIEGLDAGPASSGIHVGDTYNLRIHDLWITDFVGSGSIGAHFDNTVTISERARVQVTIDNCATAVVFQTEADDTPSFDYSDWDFILNCFANQDGVVIRGSAQIIHGSLGIRGDCYNTILDGPYAPGSGWVTTEENTGVFLTVGEGDGTPFLEHTNLTIAVEAAGIIDTAPGHTTINIGAGADIWGTGILSFRFNEGFSWTPGTNDGWFAFAGYRNVDSTYGVMDSPQTFSVSGAMTGAAGNAVGAEIQLRSSNVIQYLLSAGLNELTFSFEGMSGAAVWDIALLQPSSGDATVTLPENFRVLPSGGILPLTAGAFAQDLFRIVTYDMSDFYVVPVTALPGVPYWEAPPVNGVATLPRTQLNTSLPTTSGQMNVTYFEAPRGIGSTTEVAVATGDVAADGVTLAEVTLYSIDGSNNLTEIASADISSVVVSTYNNSAVPLSASFLPGHRYAVGILIVATTMPKMTGAFVVSDANYAPILCSLVSGPLSSVPSSVAVGDLSSNYLMQYARFS